MVEKDLWPIQSKLFKIINKFKVPFEMKLSDHAKERWKEVYENLSKDNGGLVGTVINGSFSGKFSAVRNHLMWTCGLV